MFDRLCHGGQRRIGGSRRHVVVEPDHGQLVWYSDPAGSQLPQRPYRHVVVGCHYRIEPIDWHAPVLEQVADSAHPRPFEKVSRQNPILIYGQIVLSHHLTEHSLSLLGVRVSSRTLDEGQSSQTVIDDQVSYQLAHAAAVVCVDGWDARQLPHGHDRQAASAAILTDRGGPYVIGEDARNDDQSVQSSWGCQLVKKGSIKLGAVTLCEVPAEQANDSEAVPASRLAKPREQAHLVAGKQIVDEKADGVHFGWHNRPFVASRLGTRGARPTRPQRDRYRPASSSYLADSVLSLGRRQAQVEPLHQDRKRREPASRAAGTPPDCWCPVPQTGHIGGSPFSGSDEAPSPHKSEVLPVLSLRLVGRTTETGH